MAFGSPLVSAASLALALLAGCGTVRAAEVLPGPVPAEVLRVIDGDTLAVRARIWLGQEVTVAVRLAGIDAPERKGRCARERTLAAAAQAALTKRAPRGAAVRLADIRADKYGGRVIARVLDDSGRDIGAALVAAGTVRRYDGHKRAPWCGPGTAER